MPVQSIDLNIRTEEARFERRPAAASRRRLWAVLDTLLCFVAMFGVGASLAPDYRQVRSNAYVATDFKTLYASVDLYREGREAYDVDGLVSVFRRDRVVEPETWFGRKPVYPPVTLALFSPLSRLPMGTAAIVWWILSLLATGGALAFLLREARAQQLNLMWRLALLGVAAGSPLLAFSLDIGNVSAFAAALTTMAWMLAIRPFGNGDAAAREKLFAFSVFMGGFALAMALTIKPHLAFWVMLGLALAGRRAGRWIAGVATLFFGFVCLGWAVVSMMGGKLGGVVHSYSAVLRLEQTTGSMSPCSREVLWVGAQICSLRMLFSPWWWGGGTIALLLLIAGLLLAASRGRVRRVSTEGTLLFVSAIAGFGLIATYHRTHDGVVLLPWLLWVCLRLRELWRGRTNGWRHMGQAAWLGAALVLYALTWIAFPQTFLRMLGEWPWLADWLNLRQAALAYLLLAGWMAVTAARQAYGAGRGGDGRR